jgi:hypothetical protein
MHTVRENAQFAIPMRTLEDNIKVELIDIIEGVE